LQGQILPLEVKAASNTRSRSLSVYANQHAPAVCLRTSLLPHRDQDWLRNIPLYGLTGWLRLAEAK